MKQKLLNSLSNVGNALCVGLIFISPILLVGFGLMMQCLFG